MTVYRVERFDIEGASLGVETVDADPSLELLPLTGDPASELHSFTVERVEG